LPAAREEEVQQALSRVLNSKYFIHAPKKQKFLRLICEFYLNGRAGELNEYLIGREVFDRDEGYNPSVDPIVRVGAHDIRKKLELYYQNEGKTDEFRLDIPIGSYEPIFIKIQHPDPPPEQFDERHQNQSSTRKPSSPEAGKTITETIAEPASANSVVSHLQGRLHTLYAIIALLLAALSILAYLYFSQREQNSGAVALKEPNALGSVWEPFLNSGDSTLLVLSNPLVYRLMNAGDSGVVLKGSVELPMDKVVILGQALRDNFAVRNSPPNPRLVLSLDTYTGLGEAIGAQRVTDLLRTAGKNVAIKRSRTVSADDLKDHHVILFGSVWSNEWSGKLSVIEDFHVTGQATIENHHPLPGESHEYRSKFDESSGRLIEDYALVTVKPNISSSNVVMVLAGLRSAGTEAAAEYVTNKSHLNDLNRRLLELGGRNSPPVYYQALLRVGVENGIPTTISLIGLHELRNKGQ
jgi:hypothetical protein